MDKVFVFADHEIGYRLTKYLIVNQSKDYKVVKVYTNKHIDPWWKKMEDDLDIKDVLHYYDHKETPVLLLNEEVSYLFLLSWKHIVPNFLLSHVTKGVVNLHYSLLPRHRGVYPVNWAIQSGDSETGVTFHFVDDGIDTGPIIVQKRTSISWCDDAYSLLRKLDQVAYDLFQEIWPNRSNWLSWTNNYKQGVNGSYHSKKEYISGDEVFLEKGYLFKDILNFIRARTFMEDSRVFFTDSTSGKRYKVKISIEPIP